MKLHQVHATPQHRITAYRDRSIDVNGVQYEGSLLVTASTVSAWPVTRFSALRADDFAALLPLHPAVVLLGTGETLRFPHPQLVQPLTDQQIGVEAMDIGAACRTFNILVAEDRQVVLAVVYD